VTCLVSYICEEFVERMRGKRPNSLLYAVSYDWSVLHGVVWHVGFIRDEKYYSFNFVCYVNGLPRMSSRLWYSKSRVNLGSYFIFFLFKRFGAIFQM
jgi:hypothetical protein